MGVIWNGPVSWLGKDSFLRSFVRPPVVVVDLSFPMQQHRAHGNGSWMPRVFVVGKMFQCLLFVVPVVLLSLSGQEEGSSSAHVRLSHAVWGVIASTYVHRRSTQHETDIWRESPPAALGALIDIDGVPPNILGGYREVWVGGTRGTVPAYRNTLPMYRVDTIR